MDHPVAILPIACRCPSTLPLTFNPGTFGLLRGFLPTGMGEGRPPRPALSEVSAMCCCSWRAPTQFFQFGRIVETEPCPKSPTRGSAIRAIISHSEGSEHARQKHHESQLRARAQGPLRGRSISPREFISQCVFGNVSSQLKQSRRPPAIMRRSDWSSRERPSWHIEGQLVLLEKGDSWVVPKGSRHTYKVIETFTAVEATSPTAEVHGRDE